MHDHDLAARIAGAGDVVLLAVDHPLVAVEHGPAGDVLGVRRRDVGLGHRVRRADLAVEQRLEPLLLLLRRADALEHLHVAGVGRGAVEALRRERVLAELVGDVGVVEVATGPRRSRRSGRKKFHRPLALALALTPSSSSSWPVAVAPALGPALAEPVVLLGDRLDLVGDERLHRLVERDGVLGHRQVQGVVGGDTGVHSWCGHGSRSLWRSWGVPQCDASAEGERLASGRRGHVRSRRARAVPHLAGRRLGSGPAGRRGHRQHPRRDASSRGGLHPLLVRRAGGGDGVPVLRRPPRRSCCCASTRPGRRAPIVVEDLVGSGVEFPHVYGPIDVAAVVDAQRGAPDQIGF